MIRLILFMICLFLLVACGRKGELKPPPDFPDEPELERMEEQDR